MTPGPLPRVAYFSMEFGLHEDLPLYAGGLGILAGDVLKGAHDRQLPLVGIGILWSEGYGLQGIGSDGQVRDEHSAVPREALEPVDASFVVRVRGADVPLVAWRTTAHGNAPLYLLEPRDEQDRWITRRLYQGGFDDRIAQEIVLGVGGVRLLRALRHEVDLYHFNEGHAVLAGLELVRESMAEGRSFEDARRHVRDRIVFTTHTPVVAGNEAHHVSALVAQGADLGTFSEDELRELAGEHFNMTVAGLRLASRANAVSALHARTCERMWRDVPDTAPIVAVTNGVHVPTWQDPRVRDALAGGDLQEAHAQLKRELLWVIRELSGADLPADGLLVGFARRIVPYKRPDLIFRDPERIGPYLRDGRLQLVFAGKTHPEHAEAKGLISHLVEMARRFPESVAFLPDYDMALGRLLTRGCDAWLNNPSRPQEASGTSGMKAAMNGVLNVSVLDGWWAEACEHGVNGWQFGDGYEGAGQTEHDLAALYNILEDDVLPTFHEDREGWLAMMKASIESTQERFSADRMLADYQRLLYDAEGRQTG